MYNNESVIQEVIKFLEVQPIRKAGYSKDGYTEDEIGRVNHWVGWQLDYEFDFGVGNHSEQLEWLNFLHSVTQEKRFKKYEFLVRLMLIKWSKKTKNLFGVAYRIGHDDGHRNGSIYTQIRLVSKVKKKLSKAGQIGAKGKHSGTAELKRWALEEAVNMRGDDKYIARKLAARLPAHLAEASRAPERLIYDALRISGTAELIREAGHT